MQKVLTLLTYTSLWSTRCGWGYFLARDAEHFHRLPKPLQSTLYVAYIMLTLWKLAIVPSKAKSLDKQRRELVALNRKMLIIVASVCLYEFYHDADFSVQSTIVEQGFFCLLKIALYVFCESLFDTFLTTRAYRRSSIWKGFAIASFTKMEVETKSPVKQMKRRVVRAKEGKAKVSAAKSHNVKLAENSLVNSHVSPKMEDMKAVLTPKGIIKRAWHDLKNYYYWGV